jgi:type 2 lantibiotic biosynthesis protein LanM
MHRVYETITKPIDQNVPMLNGVPLSPNDYLEELVEGFDQMYRFLIAQRRTLLANEFNSSQNLANPLVALQSQLVRFIFRDTQVYSAVLQKTLAPEFLRNGVDRSIQLDLLARAFLITEDKPNAWSILHSELRAMEQLDIPYFAAKSDGVALTVGVDRPLEDYLTKPSYSQVISRLQKLDETDRTRQVAIIRGAFHARVVRSHGTEQAQAEYGRGSAVSLQAIDCSTQSPLTREQLLASACAIAQEIQSHAIREADGSVYWMSLGHIPGADRLQLQPLNQSLYDGNCGIALFLAALARIGGSSQFRDLALGALVPLRKILQTIDAQAAQRLAKRIGIGGTTGLGSIVYSLVRISHFLKEDALLEEALRVADAIAPELITTDQKLDVMAGSAGAILALLALYHETTEPAILDKAIACGQHLLKYSTSFEGSPKAWKTFGEKPLTGFSHGAAGIAYALLRLYAVTQNSAYLEAALEGIAYERSVFSSSAANWPDFRSCDRQNGQPGFMVSWCHGAPGIGLARLGGLSILETEEIHQDVEVALQTTQKYGLQGLDLLCCGNFGRTELLLVAAQKLSRPELREMALQRATCVVARAEQTGAYKLFPNLPNYVFSPGFFQGTAGIGYELLRLAYPEVLPSVLLLD